MIPALWQLILTATSATCLLAGGCTTDALPWEDDPQVVAARDARRATDVAGRAVVVIAPLRNPTEAPISLASVGPGISGAIRRELSNDTRIVVRDEPGLAAEINTLLAQDRATIDRRLPALASRYPHVRLVAAGEVDRFNHRAKVAGDQRRDAQVMIEMTIIDLPAAKIVSVDTFSAQAWGEPPATMRADTTFGTALFWSSPLGLASRDVVDDAARRIRSLAPPMTDGQIRIVDQLDDRNLILSSGPITDASVGDTMYVCRRQAGSPSFAPIIDPITRKPLTAKIRSGGGKPTAWLMGSKPADTSLRGAALCRQPGAVETVRR